MKKRALQVTFDVREPSVVELTVGDKVQLDRLLAADRGCIAERHGSLLGPGASTLSLDPGLYFFKTLSNANLKVIRGGASVLATSSSVKDPTPPPLVPGSRGDEPSGEVPRLTVT